MRATLESLFRTVVIGLAVYGGLDLARSALADGTSTAYLPVAANAQELSSLEQRVGDLEDLLAHVSRDRNDLYITGANLHVVNGTGRTETTNGLGNVIVGYNESRSLDVSQNDNSGSHMLVVGMSNNYAGYGGIVAGYWNSASGPFASVSGGTGNTAAGRWSSVAGGCLNRATADVASVSGGYENHASEDYASVSGGSDNTASGMYATVSGGTGNQATAFHSSVSGGKGNVASGDDAAVGGGIENEAAGRYSSVSGGRWRLAPMEFDWRAGGLYQDS